MTKKLAWDTFKNTGNIDTFLELRLISNIEENIENLKAEKDEINKGKRDYNCRKDSIRF